MTLHRPAIAAVAALAGCGLTPYADQEQAPRGVDINGNTYAVQLAQSTVADPTALDKMFDDPDVPQLLVNVAGQGATAFLLAVAPGAPSGEQDPCEKVYTMNPGTWKQGNEFLVQGGRFFVPLGGRDVEFRGVVLEGTVDPDTEAWSGVRLGADIDTEELRGAALPADPAPCVAIANQGGACHECDGGGMTCVAVDVDLVVSLTSVDFDPEVTGCR